MVSADQRTPADHRRSCARVLRGLGWSLRRIAEYLGAPVMTVWRDTRCVMHPDRVIGRDGHSYPARRSL